MIEGVHVVPLRKFGDERGHFFETFRRAWIPDAREMVQGNYSFSKAGVLRGMHYHLRQADFWAVPSGSVQAALYDLRRSSLTSGQSQMIRMGDFDLIGLYIPPGVAHGFFALTDAVMTYLVDAEYDGTDERGVRWNDPALGLAWGVVRPVLSERDQNNPLLAELPADILP